MTAADPRADYAAFTRGLIENFRANGGTLVNFGPMSGRPLLLLHTVGAKSGEERIAPLMFSRDGDRYVVMGSKSGAPEHPAWLANIEANPEVTVEAGGETFKARAHVYREGAERDRLWDQHAAEHPQFHDYESMTARVIPAVALERIG